MKTILKSQLALFACLCLLGGAFAQAQSGNASAPGAPAPKPGLVAAAHQANISKAMVLGATVAGHRFVAVGEAGAVMLSDDAGKTFRQARSVPVDTTLTSVTFVDAKHGWAAGHGGVILHTSDGGETWTLQRSDLTTDQPIFSIVFRDAQRGWAVGLWSLLLTTGDGGRTWQDEKPGEREGIAKGGINFYSIFLGANGHVYATGEQGIVLRSTDDGQNWMAVNTGYKGSLWAGTEAADGTVYVGGLRGNMFRSRNQGMNWEAVSTGGAGSITALNPTDNGVAGAGLDGSIVFKKNGDTAFATRHVAGRPALTALAVNGRGQAVYFSKQGIIYGHD